MIIRRGSKLNGHIPLKETLLAELPSLSRRGSRVKPSQTLFFICINVFFIKFAPTMSAYLPHLCVPDNIN